MSSRASVSCTTPGVVDEYELADVSKDWSLIKKRMYKTQVCKYYIRGKCLHGSLCAFAHSIDELNRKPNLSKTRLCVKPGCNNPNCSFAHTLEELRLESCITNNSAINIGHAAAQANIDDPLYLDYFEQQRSILCCTRGCGGGGGRPGLLPDPPASAALQHSVNYGSGKQIVTKTHRHRGSSFRVLRESRTSPRLSTINVSHTSSSCGGYGINEMENLVKCLKVLSHIEGGSIGEVRIA
ncbi:hypothetical protein FOZ63_013199 [Perkinsus olseni]|uniref:C3H1-type domain-containing protein n=1 Tax=Perkinsus olseni TaxID=32597 RepID=A0A7J6UP76_PEROL|nr:hypothetical protein FOZ62_007718 [Perkinsus olseni]KAF4758997.1 hypothetical protein FOZ63_013199 [Perkinsus olseni]